VAGTRPAYLRRLVSAKPIAEELQAAIVAAAIDAEARLGAANPYGQRYIVDFDFVRRGRTVRIRSTWIVRTGEDLPRLTSCYVL